MRIRKVLASSVARLDSDVRKGGGTDDTKALQSLCDIARDEGGVHIVMDGAALVSGLVLYSNTTIECMNQDCGFFQMPDSNRGIVTNAHWSRTERPDRNIRLLGGTYNQDCLHQEHDIPETPEMVGANCGDGRHGVTGIEFCGVENLLVRDLLILDFRTYAFMLTNFFRVTIENTWIDLPNRMQAQNQDGFHFWGPGQFLTIRDVGGKVGDDFMNIGPDEGDHVSSITDVLVDGVFLDDADQAIRILSRGTGLVDRITIRNMQGSYRSFGFYINSWFPDVTAGNFGDIFIENINLTHTAPNYDYRPPMLFSVGGDIRCLTVKNVRHEYPIDSRALFELGFPFHATTPRTIDDYVYPSSRIPKIQNCIIDGVTVLENADSPDLECIQVFGPIGNLVVKNVLAVKDQGVPASGALLSIHKTGHVDNLILSEIDVSGEKIVVRNIENADCVSQRGIQAKQ